MRHKTRKVKGTRSHTQRQVFEKKFGDTRWRTSISRRNGQNPGETRAFPPDPFSRPAREEVQGFSRGLFMRVLSTGIPRYIN